MIMVTILFTGAITTNCRDPITRHYLGTLMKATFNFDTRPQNSATESDAKVFFSSVWAVRSPQAIRANKHVCFEGCEKARREIFFVCRAR